MTPERDLFKKLGQLKKIQPDQNWVIFCRQNLVEKMRSEVGQQAAGPVFSLADFIWGLMPSKAVLRPAAILTLIFALFSGTGIFAFAKAKNSLPGERLYAVKIAMEQVELSVADSAEQKAEVQSEIMASRLRELTRVLDKQEPSGQKQQRVEEAVTNLQKQLLTVKEELPKLEGVEAKKVVAMAKKIDENANQAQTVLNQAKTALPETSQNLNDKINEASDEADRASVRALGVIVEKRSEADTMSEEEVLGKLTERMEVTEEKISAIEKFIADKNIGKEFPRNSELIFGLLEKAKAMLAEAQAALEAKDGLAGLQATSETSEFVKSLQKMIDGLVPQINIEEESKSETQNDIGTSSETAPAL